MTSESTIPHSASVDAPAAAIQTFLIADLRGYTGFTEARGDSEAARVADTFASIVCEQVEAAGGRVIELRGDEALATFGSARAAIAAALLLQKSLAAAASRGDLPLPVGIGLDAGEAVPVGDGFRGGALNLASRLCSQADGGEILASETVTHLARRIAGVEYVDRGRHTLKGMAERVRVIEVRPAIAPDGTEVASFEAPVDLPTGGYLGSLPQEPMVSRVDEMSTAHEIIEAAVMGKGSVLLIAGEPGVGKTRLGQEMTVLLRDNGFLIAAGRCYEPQQAVPFYPFLDVLTNIYQRAPEHTRRMVPARWPDLARLLPALALPTSDYAGPQDQQRLLWAVTGFLDAVAGARPVAILIDDLHWADTASLDLFQHLARHTAGSRILLVGTFRDTDVHRRHPLEGALRDLGREGLVLRIDLRRLEAGATTELIASVAGAQPPATFSDLVHHRTDGNPFFIQQVMRVLMERRDVSPDQGVWDQGDLAHLDVPESIRSVVGQRVARLPDDAQQILREASVLGQTFAFEDLLGLCERAERDIEVAMEAAATSGLLRESEDGYRFDHALTQQALYAELYTRRRRRLHLRAGQAIEKAQGAASDKRAAELAWHFLEGDDPEKALTYSLVAGLEAQQVFAHPDAEMRFRTAVQLSLELSDGARHALALERLGGSLFSLARLDEAIEAFEAALTAYEADGDRDSVMRVAAMLGWTHMEHATRDQGLKRLRPIYEEARQRPPTQAFAELELAMATLAWGSGLNAEAYDLARHAAEFARRENLGRLLGSAMGRVGTILDSMGRLEEAETALTEAGRLAEASGDLRTLSIVHNNLTVLLTKSGDLGELDRMLSETLDISRRLGEPIRIAWSLQFMAGIAFERGEWDRAAELADQLAEVTTSMGQTRLGSMAQFPGVLRLLRSGAQSDADALETLADSLRTSNVTRWAGIVGWLVLWDLSVDRPEIARERMRAVLAEPYFEAQELPALRTTLARCEFECGNLDEAERIARDVVARMNESGYSLHANKANQVLALALAARGRFREARSLSEQSIGTMSSLGLRWSEALERVDFARICAMEGDLEEAMGQLATAEECVRSLGSGMALNYIDRLRATLAPPI